MLTVLIFFLVLAVLVLAHEWGHYISAVKTGIKVEEFGVGFPPRLFGAYKKNGKWRWVWGNKEITDADGTVYSFNLIPLGGFNKIKGENNSFDWYKFDQRLAEYRQALSEEKLSGQEQKNLQKVLSEEGQALSLFDSSFNYENYLKLSDREKLTILENFTDNRLKNDKDAFYTQAAWKRLLVLVSGPFMNFVLAMGLLAIGFMIGLPEVVDDQTVSETPARVQVYEVFEDSPAKQAGLQLGDFILAVNGQTLNQVDPVIEMVKASEGQAVVFEIEREKKVLTLNVVPELISTPEQDYFGIGVSLVRVSVVKYPWYEALWLGVKQTFLTIWLMITTLAAMIVNLFKEGEPGVALAGPIGIASLTGKFARMGFNYLLQFAAMFSINLGILNLFPFPALDGGRIVFILAEKLRGKPVSSKVEAWSHVLGFGLLITLVVVVTFKEVLQLINN